MAEEPWLKVRLGRHEVLMPPDRHAAPAAVLPPLEEGTVVTWGAAGAGWLVDAGETIAAPENRGGEDHYEVRPWGGGPGARVPASRLWVYQDAQQDRRVTDLAPLNEYQWFDRVQEDDRTPPPVRRPRPARELPSLSGRIVRLLTASETWGWFVAASEPRRTTAEDGREGDIAVRVVQVGDRSVTVPGAEPEHGPWLVALNTLWTY